MKDFNQTNDLSSLQSANDLIIEQPTSITAEELQNYRINAKDLRNLLESEELWHTAGGTLTTQELTDDAHTLSSKLQAIKEADVDTKTLLKIVKAAYGDLILPSGKDLFTRVTTQNGHFLTGEKAEKQLSIWQYLMKNSGAIFITESSRAGAETIGKGLGYLGGDKAPDPNERGQTVSLLFDPAQFELVSPKPVYFNSVKNIKLPGIPKWLRTKLYESLRTAFAYKVRHTQTKAVGWFIVWHLKSNLPVRSSDITTSKIRENQVVNFLAETALRTLDGEFVILGGDANSPPSAPEFQKLWDHGFVVSGPDNDVPSYVGHSGKARFDWFAFKGLNDFVIGEPILPDLRNAEHIRPAVERAQALGVDIDTTGEFMEYYLHVSDHLAVSVELTTRGA
jgi:hypothetical protein